VPYLHRRLSAGEPADLTSGTQLRDFLDVDKAAAMLVKEALAARTGAVNIASGEGITVRALAERIADGYGRRDLLNFGARPDNITDPPCVVGVKAEDT
ncbi:NAD(P)-dependent oxidoreductase, partial [bacterium]|nr:NAD(P)-dependent oxidoreductase [bacterium]